MFSYSFPPLHTPPAWRKHDSYPEDSLAPMCIRIRLKCVQFYTKSFVEGSWGKGWIFVILSRVMEERGFFVCLFSTENNNNQLFFSDVVQCVQLHTPSRTVVYTLSYLQGCVTLEVGEKIGGSISALFLTLCPNGGFWELENLVSLTSGTMSILYGITKKVMSFSKTGKALTALFGSLYSTVGSDWCLKIKRNVIVLYCLTEEGKAKEAIFLHTNRVVHIL